ncbi:MAG: L-2-hydroxyglutarate oxidase [Bdellovibrionaceae bacterium]|nr:L-2-hydroxyglutarate oxidase [Pseudobdellovibrionaceae bacterium]NUM58612.1 L-2-hydroxyglutarate oxidase [Pseudobdellovibrionaceae bacterium]
MSKSESLQKNNVDFLIIGSGIIGTALSIEIKKKYPQRSVLLIDKEKQTAYHSSGRNSGVLHAGFYYTADSLKALLCRQGNEILTDYCLTMKLRINQCGKLVVAKNESELEGLNTLSKRAQVNGVTLHEITEKEALELEPRVKTHQRALYSPKTSVIDPKEVLNHLLEQAQKMGVLFQADTAFIKNLGQQKVLTSKQEITAGYIINCAGLYADQIAKQYGFCKDMTIIPFKGIYLYSDQNPTVSPLKRHIYPVPNLNNPFLGVHHTITVDGKSKIGPTAIPAFWREQYSGLSRFNAKELVEISTQELKLFLNSNFNFRELALTEFKKYYKPNLVHEAQSMAKEVHLNDYKHWGKPGIRAQLFDLKKQALVMDFCYQGDSHSFHVLNAVSPAFTCSIPFARLMLEKIEQHLSSPMNSSPTADTETKAGDLIHGI